MSGTAVLATDWNITRASARCMQRRHPLLPPPLKARGPLHVQCSVADPSHRGLEDLFCRGVPYAVYVLQGELDILGTWDLHAPDAHVCCHGRPRPHGPLGRRGGGEGPRVEERWPWCTARPQDPTCLCIAAEPILWHAMLRGGASQKCGAALLRLAAHTPMKRTGAPVLERVGCTARRLRSLGTARET